MRGDRLIISGVNTATSFWDKRSFSSPIDPTGICIATVILLIIEFSSHDPAGLVSREGKIRRMTILNKLHKFRTMICSFESHTPG